MATKNFNKIFEENYDSTRDGYETFYKEQNSGQVKTDVSETVMGLAFIGVDLHEKLQEISPIPITREMMQENITRVFNEAAATVIGEHASGDQIIEQTRMTATAYGIVSGMAMAESEEMQDHPAISLGEWAGGIVDNAIKNNAK